MSEKPFCTRMNFRAHPTDPNDYYLYCSPPSKGNVSYILDHETTNFCDKCPDYLAPGEEE